MTSRGPPRCRRRHPRRRGERATERVPSRRWRARAAEAGPRRVGGGSF